MTPSDWGAHAFGALLRAKVDLHTLSYFRPENATSPRDGDTMSDDGTRTTLGEGASMGEILLGFDAAIRVVRRQLLEAVLQRDSAIAKTSAHPRGAWAVAIEDRDAAIKQRDEAVARLSEALAQRDIARCDLADLRAQMARRTAWPYDAQPTVVTCAAVTSFRTAHNPGCTGPFSDYRDCPVHGPKGNAK